MISPASATERPTPQVTLLPPVGPSPAEQHNAHAVHVHGTGQIHRKLMLHERDRLNPRPWERVWR